MIHFIPIKNIFYSNQRVSGQLYVYNTAASPVLGKVNLKQVENSTLETWLRRGLHNLKLQKVFETNETAGLYIQERDETFK